jgi:hypothetical protein
MIQSQTSHHHNNHYQCHMYPPDTALNRHRVASTDGYWAPGDKVSTYSAMAAMSTGDGGNGLRMSSNGYTIQTSSSMAMEYFSLPVMQSPLTLQRRRSHRPRGCRGGRKNRKGKLNVSDQHPDSPPLVPASIHDGFQKSANQQHNDYVNYRHNAATSSPSSTLLKKGDLSPYQHLKLSNKPWNLGAQNLHDTSTSHGGKKQPQAQFLPQQMLPPPVPSALFESHRQNMESMQQRNSTGSGLKMLPSFDDDYEHEPGEYDDHDDEYYDDDDEDEDDSSNEGIEIGVTIHKPSKSKVVNSDGSSSHQHVTNPILADRKNCEATIATSCTISTRSCSSSCDSDNSNDAKLMPKHSNHRYFIHTQQPTSPYNLTKPNSRKSIVHIAHWPMIASPLPHSHAPVMSLSEGACGSLFVTSPRSFLFGFPTDSNGRATSDDCKEAEINNNNNSNSNRISSF